MKAFASIMGAIALLLATVTISGCNKPDDATIAKGLELTGSQGSFYGLQAWAKKDPVSAAETASRLKASTATILAYLNGADLPTSDLVQQFVDSSLLDGLQPEVKDAIMAASTALDVLLPIPSADGHLSPAALLYLKSFVTGVGKGCDQFLGKSPAPVHPKWLSKKDLNKHVWLTGTKSKAVKK